MFFSGGGSVVRAVAIYFLIQRRRSPSGHLVTRKGGTHCSDFHFGCSAVPFPAPYCLFLRRIRPHQRPGGSSYFLSERQRSPAAPCAPYGGTPCWIPFSLAVPGFALPNRFRGVRDLCLSVVEGPSCARLPIYFLIQRSIGRCCHLPGKNRLSGHKGRGRGRIWQVDKICLGVWPWRGVVDGRRRNRLGGLP